MKNLTFLLIFIINGLNIFSQTLQIDWQACLGGSNSDYAMDILELDNGFLILGNTYSNDGDISLNHGVNDLWLVRIDSIGNILWEKCYGGSESDGSHRIIKTEENNFYILGGALSSNGDISNDPYPESTDFWIVKIDSLGSILWDRIFGGNILDYMWTGTPTTDGGVVALGWTGSQDGDVTVNYGAYDMWMVKVNSEGEKEWDFSIGTNDFDYGQAIIQTSDGGFLVGGTSTLTGGGNLDCENHGEADGVLVKLDSLRNIEWQHCYGGSDYDGIYDILELDDGYLLSAFTASNDGDVSGYHGEADIWIVKIDFNGNIIWENCFGGYKGEVTYNLFKTIDEDFTFIGRTKSNDGDVSGNHSLSEYDNDIWIVKLSSEGELLSQQCIGGRGDERIDFGVVKTNDNNFVIAGQTNIGPSYDVECTPHTSVYYQPDIWVFEILDTTGVGQYEILQKQTEFLVYPNPAKDYVCFEYVLPENKEDVILSIKNMQGIETTHFILHDKKGIKVWDTRGVKQGVYFYSFKSGLRILKRGKVIIIN